MNLKNYFKMKIFRSLIPVFLSLLNFYTIFFFSAKIEAWGGRGHQTICEASVFLVQEKVLAHFLMSQPFYMSHLCIIPDSLWRTDIPLETKYNLGTHYFDLDSLGIPLDQIPTDFNEIIKKFGDKLNSLGSVWWRVDQFYNQALLSSKKMASAEKPRSKPDFQNEVLPFNKAAYETLLYMGLMGHFVGDISQPLHNTEDWDGKKHGHPGLHLFYESTIVSGYDYDLTNKVIKKAKQLLNSSNFMHIIPKIQMNTDKTVQVRKKSMKETPPPPTSSNAAEGDSTNDLRKKTFSVIELMKSLSLLSYKDINKLYEFDNIKDRQIQPPNRKVLDKYHDLIVTELARGAAILAILWEQIYIESGKPDWSSYKQHAFPFKPEFIPPDYMK